MLRSRPARDALGVLEEILGTDKSAASISRDEALSAITEFEKTQFEVLVEADSDGFIFQYGPANWIADGIVVVSILRQLALPDEPDNQGCGFHQVALEYRYRADSELSALGFRASWWFRGGEETFDSWLAAVIADPVWPVVAAKELVDFRTYADDV